MKKKNAIYIGITILLILSLWFFAQAFSDYILRDVFKSPDSIEFSKEAWNSDPYNRGGMVDDLLGKYNFISMTRRK